MKPYEDGPADYDQEHSTFMATLLLFINLGY